MYVQSLKDWSVTLRSTPELIEALKQRGIPYTTKKGCACSGGKLNVTFPGIEVVDEGISLRDVTRATTIVNA